MTFDIDAAVARMLHQHTDGLGAGAPVAPPITLASTYVLPGEPGGPYQYGRWSNPTWSAVEDALGILEDAEVVAFPSGMAATSAVLMALLKAGDRLLLPADGYYTTRQFAQTYLAPAGVAVDLVATTAFDTHDVAGARMVFAETPSNPGLDLCDLASLSERTRAAGALLVVDNTTATPLGQRPLDLGADIVVAADTKAPAGHSDVLFGHVATRAPDLAQAVREWRRISGAIPGAFEAWQVHRGLHTLELRFERMCQSAGVLAARLAEHRAVAGVVYPGLPSHPTHALAARQMRRFGSLLGVTFAEAAAAERFIARSRFLVPSTSFGGVHSSAERRARWGDAVAEGYVRLSVGCEPTEALWADLRAALDESDA